MNREISTAEGERRKADALATLEARRECYVHRGRRALLEAVLRAGTATADDVRRAVELPDGIDPRCFGSVPGLLARAGLIRRADFIKSGRAERHACFTAVWELRDRDGAVNWLRTHPDQPDPSDSDREAVQGVLFSLTSNEPGAAAATATPGLE